MNITDGSLVRCGLSNLYWEKHQSARNFGPGARASEEIRFHTGSSGTAAGDGECLVREAEELGLLCFSEADTLNLLEGETGTDVKRRIDVEKPGRYAEAQIP